MSASRLSRRAKVAIVAMRALAAVWLLLTFWLVRPYDSITFTPFTTDRETGYLPGEVVALSDVFCWDGTPFTVTARLVSAISERDLATVRFPDGYALPVIEQKYADGCEPTTVRVELPSTTPPGEYRIRYDVSYRPGWNPIRVVETANLSNPFRVLPEETP